MHYIATVMLIIAGIIHLLPISGVLGSTHLERLYGMAFTEPNLAILMRHRAVLFALLGAILIYAGFRRDLVWIAIVAGLVSTVSFVWLAWVTGGYGPAIHRIVVADLVAIAALVIAAVAVWRA